MESNEKPTPLWKKEISFRRKPAERAAESAGARVPAAEPADASEPTSTSVWKKEVSLRKKPKAVAVAVVVADEAEALREQELERALEAVMNPEPEPAAAAAPVPEPAPKPEIEHSWLTEPLEQVSEPPEELPDAPEPIVAEPIVAGPTVPQIEALDPAVATEVLAEVAQEPELELPPLAEADLPELVDLPELPAAFPVEPELAEDEPVPAAPPIPATPKVPFYKRELSVKRTPRYRKPKGKPEPRERAPKADGADRVPFYKRELSFKRGPKEWDAAEPAAEPKPKSESRFKLQLKQSDPKPAAEPKAASDSKAQRVPRPKLRRAPVPKPSLPGGKGPKKLVGLKIGASQIAAARVVNGAEPELVQIAREPLEPGIVVGGELRDPEALAVALKEFFRKHGLPKRGVRLGIANNRIGVRTFEVAGIDDPKQLANAIRFRAQEVLPIPIEEAVLDYQILSESTDAEGVLSRRVLLVVAYRELVDRYVQACNKAGIEIAGIDLEAFALLRALAEPRTLVPGDERGALVAVSVGHDRSTFAVSDGRNCEFTRVLEWGGWALNVAIARALDLAPSEAEPVKRALSFTGGELLPDGFDESQLETARDAARKQLQSFARELVSSLQFYQNQPGSLSIGEIVLTGGTPHLPGFAAELERLIGVPVRVGDPLARVKVSPRIRESEQTGSFAIAIGLGIED